MCYLFQDVDFAHGQVGEGDAGAAGYEGIDDARAQDGLAGADFA